MIRGTTSQKIYVPTYADAVLPPFCQRLLSSEPRQWEGIRAQLYQLTPPQEPYQVLLEHDTLILHLQGLVQLQRQGDGPSKQGRSSPGGLCLEPKETTCAYTWTGTPSIVLHLHLTPDLVQRVTQEVSRVDPGHVEMAERFNFRDPLLEQMGQALARELEWGGLAGRLYAESLAQSLVLHVLRTSSSAALPAWLPDHRLNSRQIQQVKDYMHEQLDQPISLAQLAQVAGLSPSHFSRQFKAATGLAPHHYLIHCRVERATSLLRAGYLTIAEVAAAVGFADQSHLHHHFKRLLGISPGHIVRESKNRHKKEQEAASACTCQ